MASEDAYQSSRKRDISQVDVVDLLSEDEEDFTRHERDHKISRTVHPSSSSTGAEDSTNSYTLNRAVNHNAQAEVIEIDDFSDPSIEEDDGWILYGGVNTKVVGVRFYKGIATRGELVTAQREPGNRYDRRAIRVMNVNHDQIGHLPRSMAAKLAPFMDQHEIVVEARLAGPIGDFDAPLDLNIFGTMDPVASRDLMQRLRDARVGLKGHSSIEASSKQSVGARGKRFWQKDGEDQPRGFTNLNGQYTGAGEGESWDSSLQDIFNANLDHYHRPAALVDKVGMSEADLETLPQADQPKGIHTKLLPYQLQGLAWMLNHENLQVPAAGSGDIVQLWQQNVDATFTNVATRYTTRRPPTFASGGILADEMGLGKTIQTISLILADPRRAPHHCAKKTPTLIITPLSVMSNWAQQAAQHVDSTQQLKVFIYHGKGRTNQTAGEFQRYDIVVTTYQTVVNEYSPQGSDGDKLHAKPHGLFSIQWRRLVLDEGHNIRNHKAKICLAATAIPTQSRWVLTGTPLVNDLLDFYSQIRFLGMTGGLEHLNIYRSVLSQPLSSRRHGDSFREASKIFQLLMTNICLRRTKAMKFTGLELPKIMHHRYAIAFHQRERKQYEVFAREAQGMLQVYQERNNGEASENKYANLLEVLLRMRQTCNHLKLCGDRGAAVMKHIEAEKLEKGQKKISLTKENIERLQYVLQVRSDSQEDCSICFETLHKPVISACAHVFGQECIERWLRNHPRCPLCRGALRSHELVSPKEDTIDETEEEVPWPFDPNESSSKIEALLSILKASAKRDQTTKTVVFSQWTRFLDILQVQLGKLGIKFCRLDGKMKAEARDQSITALSKDPTCTVMLASLSVCSVGLNLAAANQVILSDSWWAPAIEEQAIDRVHRLGQTREVHVWRLVMEDSVEEQVLKIQEQKRKLVAQAFADGIGTESKKEKRTRLADIERLLAPANHDMRDRNQAIENETA